MFALPGRNASGPTYRRRRGAETATSSRLRTWRPPTAAVLGKIYFLTDGAPVEFRAFITAQARAHGVELREGSVPRGVLYAVAAVKEFA